LRSTKGLVDATLSVAEAHLNTVFLVEVLCQVLCGVNRTMLSTCAAERKHK